MKEKAMTGSREIGQLVVLLLEDASELFHAEFAASDLQHRADQAAHHPAQKSVGFYTINKALFVFFPNAFDNGTEEGFYLGIALGECGEILVGRDKGGSGGQFAAVKGIGIEPGAIREEGILDPIYVVPVFPAGGIEPTVGLRSDAMEFAKNDVRWQDRVDII